MGHHVPATDFVLYLAIKLRNRISVVSNIYTIKDVQNSFKRHAALLHGDQVHTACIKVITNVMLLVSD